MKSPSKEGTGTDVASEEKIAEPAAENRLRDSFGAADQSPKRQRGVFVGVLFA